MSNDLSRRAAIARIGTASAALLLTRRFAAAELFSALSEKIPSAPVGMDLTITAVTPHTLRINIAAVDESLDRYYEDGALAPRNFGAPLATLRTDSVGQEIPFGDYRLTIATKPLRITATNAAGKQIQELTFRPDLNQIGFLYNDAPIYGMGTGVHPMDRRGGKDMMRNGSGDNLRIFGARNPIPWLMGKGFGLFFHEPGGQFDLSGDTGFFKPSDVARGQDLFLVLAETPAELLRQYAEITGYPHLPARWTFGFQQSHRTIDTRAQIIDEAKTFREKKLPCDTVIYLGTGFCPSGWNTGHGSFVFNQALFPDPAQVIKEFHDLHMNVVLHVVNPPENLHGHVTDTGTAASFPANAANYWKQHVPFIEEGVDGWWPDEGDVLPQASRLVRNRMYWEGGRMTRPDRRPFALHRNCYAGIQRWGWLWSGDTFSTWKTLETQIMIGIGCGLSGVPYWGTDIGGFVPTKEFTAELFVRWFQFGAFCPSFRCHGRTWQLRRPWGWDTGTYGASEMGTNAEAFLPKGDELHNKAVEPICRAFLNTRYQLMPYLYSAAYETHTTGLPLIRSLGLAFPNDAQSWSTVDAYLYGPSLLVAPVFERGATSRKVYLPAGPWYDYWTGKRTEGGTTITVATPLESMPLFVRAGAILPTGPIKQYTAEPSTEPTHLTIYPGADGRFTLYDDDGLTFEYEKGRSTKVELTWTESTRTLQLTADNIDFQHYGFIVSLVGGEKKTVAAHRGTQTINL
ncbi:glycoside hydrolase family 31 protein [Granulicella tundricola]|uniref:Glycoside hydrolase family 31 n=1 Tax=Granulicella tundricola (strain ATCC BAA-1859 / DSM 23138 / MP5ACTX9) TaxID=1198114 RepID=E8X6F1_GRATM|nr:TIM-barrel domain-containing protein [Granulicella tundricola]ADW71035.1 glycoside hydrolase family 31 [Granulicella tundricola MP5ACTX9]